MKSVRWLVSYILVASLGLWLAFAVSVKFMTPARSQSAPTNGDLPAEFLKDVENTQVPVNAAPNGATPGGSATPAATAAPTSAQQPAVNPPPPSEPSAVPAPPENAAEIPMGDGMTAPGSVPAAPPIPSNGYVYDPTGKRDPFRPFRTVRPVLDKREVQEPLQRWETEKLQVVGILWDVGTPRAMIRDPEGAVHTIIKNSKVGRAEGFVATIREGEIIVVETRYEDGKSFKENRVLELKK